MKAFEKCAAQGDLMIRRINKLPEGLSSIPAENGRYILAHSETGHHHSVLERPEISLFSFSELISYLRIAGDESVELQHERAFDTHESILINPGIYELRRQREYTPEGWRKAAD